MASNKKEAVIEAIQESGQDELEIIQTPGYVLQYGEFAVRQRQASPKIRPLETPASVAPLVEAEG